MYFNIIIKKNGHQFLTNVVFLKKNKTAILMCTDGLLLSIVLVERKKDFLFFGIERYNASLR
jgi:hypothetical protein